MPVQYPFQHSTPLIIHCTKTGGLETRNKSKATYGLAKFALCPRAFRHPALQRRRCGFLPRTPSMRTRNFGLLRRPKVEFLNQILHFYEAHIMLI